VGVEAGRVLAADAQDPVPLQRLGGRPRQADTTGRRGRERRGASELQQVPPGQSHGGLLRAH
jgi:hypothetical protein